MPTTSQTVANGVRYNPAIAWLTLALLIVAACAGPKGKAVVIDRSYETYRHTAVKRGDYVIQRGDTVYGVAQRNGVSTRALIDRNKLLPPYYLVPGQTLGIPSIRIYTVRAGDSIYAISRRFDADMTTLVRLNGLPAPYTLQVGQRLKLPAGAELGTQVTTNSQGSNLPRDVKITAGPSVKPKPQMKAASLPRPPSRTGNDFVWPVEGRLVSTFGAKIGGQHNDGVNIAAPHGTPVRAAENGVVAYAGREIRGFGNLLLIKHEGGLITAYAHADSLLVVRGDVVTRGQVIAKVGTSGGVDHPQLHFEVRRGTKAVDPKQFLPT